MDLKKLLTSKLCRLNDGSLVLFEKFCNVGGFTWTGKIYSPDKWNSLVKEVEDAPCSLSELSLQCEVSEHLKKLSKNPLPLGEFKSAHDLWGRVFDGITRLTTSGRIFYDSTKNKEKIADYNAGKLDGTYEPKIHLVKTEDDIVGALTDGKDITFFLK